MAKLSQAQASSLQVLLENLTNYEKNGFGKIYNVMLMTNKFFPNTIFIRFESTSAFSTSEQYDFKIVEMKSDGSYEDINGTFKNARERYAFLGECLPFSKEEIEVING